MKTLMLTLDDHAEHIWEIFKQMSPKMDDSRLISQLLLSSAVSFVDHATSVDKADGAKAAKVFGLKPKDEAS